MLDNIFPVIMCGGSGTRLWPLSRSMFPKQFLSLTSEQSMLQETLSRLPQEAGQPICICNEEHRFLVAEQLRATNTLSSILLEPEGRNTAPAIALAAFKVLQENPDGIMLVLASDHVIKNVDAFQQATEIATQAAMSDLIVTFGIVPTHAETGYGYIKKGANQAAGCAEIEKFVEKPNQETANQYVSSGDYLWNSGMFVCKAATFLSELKRFRSDIFDACELAMKSAQPDLDFIRPNSEYFLKCPSESIDYAVMEKTKKAVVVPLEAGWSDVGSYSALWDVLEQDEHHNVVQGDVISIETSNSYICSQNKLIATFRARQFSRCRYTRRCACRR